jgi:hypothetical protein
VIKPDLEIRKISIHEVTEILGILFRSFQSILCDNLNRYQIAAKLVQCVFSVLKFLVKITLFTHQT